MIGTAQESCNLVGTTAATCTATIKATAQGTSASTTVSTATTETVTGSTYHRFDVEITGGAEKTASATATCGKKSAAAGFDARRIGLWAMAAVVSGAGVQMVL